MIENSIWNLIDGLKIIVQLNKCKIELHAAVLDIKSNYYYLFQVSIFNKNLKKNKKMTHVPGR